MCAFVIIHQDDPGLELLYRDAWHKDSDQDYHEFWNEVVPPWVFFAVFPQQTGKGTVMILLTEREREKEASFEQVLIILPRTKVS